MKKLTKVLLIALVIICLSVFVFSCNGKKVTQTEVQVLDDRFDLTNHVLNYIKDNYYDDVDYDEADFYAAYGIVSSLGNYNYIYSSEDLLGSDGKGFGLIVRNTVYNEHVIDFILPGSPFLQPFDGYTPQRGDEIYAIDANRMSGLSSSLYSAFLSTLPSDREVTFTLLRDGEKFDVKYQKVDFSFPNCIYINDLPGVSSEFGYICLRTFDKTTNVLDEFKDAVRSFNEDGNRALILDLRGNGGGSSDVFRQVASALIGNDVDLSGPILEIHYAKENRSVYVRPASVEYKIDTPVYVLCDGGTASASEALIGTMKAHNTLTALIGKTTVGKGVAQNGFTTYEEGEKGIIVDKGIDENGNEVDLDLYFLQIIVGKYYIYDGSVEGGKYCIHENPFNPDIAVTGDNIISPDYSEDLYIREAIEHYNNHKSA